MRPQYHYAAAANWLSDPNGLVHHQGEWHLYYQYNPSGEDWGNMSWGHAVSRDLCSWQELPVAIAANDKRHVFSGCAVIDSEDFAGFGPDAFIALYTAYSVAGPSLQTQDLAVSHDLGRTFQDYAGNPVIDRNLADFRDPNVFWHAPSRRWIMVVVLSNEQRAVVYGSTDLKRWDELSAIEGGSASGKVWECPLLIELPVEGTAESRWLFKVDVLHEGPGSGAIYQTGSFDGVRFEPDSHEWRVVDHGRDFYAAIAWHEPRDDSGRPVWIGWMGNHAYQGKLPPQGWRGAMSMPRRISLVRDGATYRLRQIVVDQAVARVPQIAAEASEVACAAQMELPDGDCMLEISDPEGRVLCIERSGGSITVQRRDPQSPFLDDTARSAAFDNEPVVLWLDTGSIELFAEAGCCVMTLQHRLAGETFTLRVAPAP